MAWVRIDDGFAEHPKVLGLSDAAFRLHVHALCYVARMLTNGRIPRVWLTGGKSRKLPKAAPELVDARVWDEDDDGFLIHDYLAYQPSRDDVTGRREQVRLARAEAGRAGGLRSAELRREANQAKQREANEANGQQNDLKQRSKGAAPSHPIPSPRDRTEPEGFAEFWKSYPRKQGKAKAVQAWKSAELPDLSVVLAAVSRQAQLPQWQKDGGQFIPHASTWLNQRRWEDVLEIAPPPDRGGERTAQHLEKVAGMERRS